MTEIENLHFLCWSHHQVKTARNIDPVRLRDDGSDSCGGVERGMRDPHGGSPASPVGPGTSGPEASAGIDAPGTPVSRTRGRTHWALGDAVELTVEDEGDLMTSLIVRELETAWHQHLTAQRPSDGSDETVGSSKAPRALPLKESAPLGDPPF